MRLFISDLAMERARLLRIEIELTILNIMEKIGENMFKIVSSGVISTRCITSFFPAKCGGMTVQ
jgi:hypothetical protein